MLLVRISYYIAFFIHCHKIRQLASTSIVIVTPRRTTRLTLAIVLPIDSHLILLSCLLFFYFLPSFLFFLELYLKFSKVSLFNLRVTPLNVVKLIECTLLNQLHVVAAFCEIVQNFHGHLYFDLVWRN